MSSLARRSRSAANGRPDPGELMPPDLRAFGAAPFGDAQRARLNSWLREGGWPRERMDIAMLEGYLVALLAWPVGISAGAWLPPIWGERGWKVPTKIAARPQYEEFVGLVAGFMRDIDRALSRRPSRFESSTLRLLANRERDAGLHAWGKGFMTALTLGSQGLKWRSESAANAVRVIAAATSASAPFGPNAVDEVVSAVLALIDLRTSRGPLGPLETATLLAAPEHEAHAEPDTTPRRPAKRST
jgi:yecA family protein